MNTYKFNPCSWYSLTYFKNSIYKFLTSPRQRIFKKFPETYHTFKMDYFCQSYGRMKFLEVSSNRLHLELKE
jgi:hypothetical protein